MLKAATEKRPPGSSPQPCWVGRAAFLTTLLAATAAYTFAPDLCSWRFTRLTIGVSSAALLLLEGALVARYEDRKVNEPEEPISTVLEPNPFLKSLNESNLNDEELIALRSAWICLDSGIDFGPEPPKLGSSLVLKILGVSVEGDEEIAADIVLEALGLLERGLQPKVIGFHIQRGKIEELIEQLGCKREPLELLGRALPNTTALLPAICERVDAIRKEISGEFEENWARWNAEEKRAHLSQLKTHLVLPNEIDYVLTPGR